MHWSNVFNGKYYAAAQNCPDRPGIGITGVPISKQPSYFLLTQYQSLLHQAHWRLQLQGLILTPLLNKFKTTDGKNGNTGNVRIMQR
jgi:hypothetical protein